MNSELKIEPNSSSSFSSVESSTVKDNLEPLLPENNLSILPSHSSSNDLQESSVSISQTTGFSSTVTPHTISHSIYPLSTNAPNFLLNQPSTARSTYDPLPSSLVVSHNETCGLVSPGKSYLDSTLQSHSSFLSTSFESFNKRFPIRPGIEWKNNSRIEALDYMNKWYPAKIVEVDDEDLTVLIHFDGWNQRYDEWVEMTSPRLRPLARHSDRKEKKVCGKNKASKAIHRSGELVFAKWTDCRLYPAKILNYTKNGSYDVLFYDGFKKTVLPINIKQMPYDVQKEIVNAGLFIQAEKKYRGRVPQLEIKLEVIDTPRKTRIEDYSKLAREGLPDYTFEERRRSKEQGDDWRKFKELSILTNCQASLSPVSQDLPANKVKRRLSSASVSPVLSQKKSKLLEIPSPVLPIDTKPCENKKEVPLASPKSKLTSNINEVAAKAFKVEDDHNQYKCLFDNCGKGFRKETLLEYHIKYYHTDAEAISPSSQPQNPIKKRNKTVSICSTDSESQSFTSSTNQVSDVQPSNKPLNKTKVKQESIESTFATESERVESQCPGVAKETSQLTSAEKLDNVVELKNGDAPDIKPAPLETRQSTDSQVDAEEAPITYDTISKEDVVNCICQLNEENGLMIQCEVCLCWQHAICMELSEETLPKKYICFICLNPPGVRDSARYIYNQDWHKQGVLARFNFLPSDTNEDRKSPVIQATHDLAGDLHHLFKVMHSIKLAINALKKKDKSEIQLWSKNWNHVQNEKKKLQSNSKNSKSDRNGYSDISSNNSTLTRTKHHNTVTTYVNGDIDYTPKHPLLPAINQERSNQKSLLENVTNLYDQIEKRLDFIEEQVSMLEEAECSGQQGDILSDVPLLKKVINQLLYDLNKIKKISMYH